MPERKIEYQDLNQKADSGFLVSAPSLARLYIDAGLALTDHLVRLEQVECRESRKLAIKATDRPTLMLEWLNGLVGLFENGHFLSRRIVFDQFDGKSLAATMQGELYEPVRHGHAQKIKLFTTGQVQLGETPSPDSQLFVRIVLGR